MIIDRSRDPDKSIVGSSGVVAKHVTQSPWPSSVPLNINCSMMADFRVWEFNGIGICSSHNDVDEHVMFNEQRAMER